MSIRSYQAFDLTSAVSVTVADFVVRLGDVIERFVSYASSQGLASRDDVREGLRDQMEKLAPGHQIEEGDEAAAFVEAVLDVDPKSPEAREPVAILKTKLTALQYFYRYAEAQVLVGVLGREKGIAAAKDHLDWVIEQRPLNPSGPETIAEMRERDIPWNLDDKGQDAISALVSEHQCMKKVTACRTYAVLKHLPDSEVAEAVACYPDHASIQRSNPHFVLTRTQTLIGGAAYCDTCFHDERYAADFVHPGIDVFDGLGFVEEG